MLPEVAAYLDSIERRLGRRARRTERIGTAQWNGALGALEALKVAQAIDDREFERRRERWTALARVPDARAVSPASGSVGDALRKSLEATYAGPPTAIPVFRRLIAGPVTEVTSRGGRTRVLSLELYDTCAAVTWRMVRDQGWEEDKRRNIQDIEVAEAAEPIGLSDNSNTAYRVTATWMTTGRGESYGRAVFLPSPPKGTGSLVVSILEGSIEVPLD